MEDWEQKNFATVRAKFRKGELSREQRKGRFGAIQGNKKAALWRWKKNKYIEREITNIFDT